MQSLLFLKVIYGSSDASHGNQYVILLVTSLFWMQSSVNFILYAASNKQYREAYFLFLREAVFHLDNEEIVSSGSRVAIQ